MTKGNHTSTPWEVTHGGIVRGPGRDICEVYSAHDRDFEAEANGHLIAAAPELKTELENSNRLIALLLSDFLKPNMTGEQLASVYQQIENNRAAIANATGTAL